MSVLGSISDQTLAGVVTTATHGTGVNFTCISAYVLALTVLLADGSIVDCSRTQRSELFMASLCGLGATGIVLRVKLQVEPAFRLREELSTVPFREAVTRLDELAHSGEHVRVWWFPAGGVVRVGSASRTSEVSISDSVCLVIDIQSKIFIQLHKPSGSWLWASFLGFHVIQFLLFLGRFIRQVIPIVGRFAAWLERNPAVIIDDSHKIFNVECRVRHTPIKSFDLK
jgi:L-gulonolactone oxidase